MPSKIGVMFRREQHPATLIDYARRVESMGIDQLWVVEDCFYTAGVSLAAIALAATSHIQVGLGINPGVARNPAFLAMEYATLATAFPGRFIGGVGHGVADWMEQIGARPASWLRSMEETITAVRRILQGNDVTVSGQYVNLDHVKLELAPEQVPPVLLGVRGEKSLRLAGKCADGVLLAEDSAPDYVRWARAHVESGLLAEGRTETSIVVVYANCVVSDESPAEALQQIRELVASNNAGGIQPILAHLPYFQEMRDLASGGRETLIQGMPDAWLHDLAITGTHNQALASIDALAGAGADSVVLVPPADADWDAWLANPFMQVVVTKR